MSGPLQKLKDSNPLISSVAGLVAIAATLLVWTQTCWAEVLPDPYEALYDAIMIRQKSSGETIGRDSNSPLIFYGSRYLIRGETHTKFVDALDRFSALSQNAIESHGPVKRALMQRHLWSIFDWAAGIHFERDELNVAQLKTNQLNVQLKVASLINF